MSTTLGKVLGRVETHLPLKDKPTYNLAYLRITRFWGGINKGVMYQLSIDCREKHSHIQLTKDQRDLLINKLTSEIE